VMAALAGVVHDRQAAACTEHDHRENDQQVGLHWNLATAAPDKSKFNRGSNEPRMNGQFCGRRIRIHDLASLRRGQFGFPTRPCTGQ
jgi:hypothetical protein